MLAAFAFDGFRTRAASPFQCEHQTVQTAADAQQTDAMAFANGARIHRRRQRRGKRDRSGISERLKSRKIFREIKAQGLVEFSPVNASDLMTDKSLKARAMLRRKFAPGFLREPDARDEQLLRVRL